MEQAIIDLISERLTTFWITLISIALTLISLLLYLLRVLANTQKKVTSDLEAMIAFRDEIIQTLDENFYAIDGKLDKIIEYSRELHLRISVAEARLEERKNVIELNAKRGPGRPPKQIDE